VNLEDKSHPIIHPLKIFALILAITMQYLLCWQLETFFFQTNTYSPKAKIIQIALRHKNPPKQTSIVKTENPPIFMQPPKLEKPSPPPPIEDIKTKPPLAPEQPKIQKKPILPPVEKPKSKKPEKKQKPVKTEHKKKNSSALLSEQSQKNEIKDSEQPTRTTQPPETTTSPPALYSNQFQDIQDIQDISRSSEENPSYVNSPSLTEAYLLQISKILNRNKNYPQRARNRKISGDVEVTFFIARNGKANKIKIISSPEPILSDAVKKTLTSTRFPSPPTDWDSEKPVSLTVSFSLR